MGPEAFKPTLRISFDNFLLKKSVKDLEGKLLIAQQDAKMVTKFDQESLALGHGKLAGGELVALNKKLTDDM